jgi:hypothetical protein
MRPIETYSYVATASPRETFTPVATRTLLPVSEWTDTRVASAPAASQKAVVDKKKEGDSVGLLVVNILVMVLVCGLFTYLMYREKKRRDEARKAQAVRSVPVRNSAQGLG